MANNSSSRAGLPTEQHTTAPFPFPAEGLSLSTPFPLASGATVSPPFKRFALSVPAEYHTALLDEQIRVWEGQDMQGKNDVVSLLR